MRITQQKQSLEKWMKWEQQGNLSSHWTIAFSNRWFLLLLFFVFTVHTFLASTIPPAEDELYYWAWAQKLRLSYYDHPPMVAYLIKLSTTVFGDTLLGIRFFACLSSFVVLYLMSQFTAGKGVFVSLLFTPLVLLGGILMTPDTPFFLFWTLYVFWLTRINRVFSEWSDDPLVRVYRSAPIPYLRWGVGGVLLGLGLLSKYSMFLAIPCAFLVLISRYRAASWLRGFLFHLFVAGIVLTPVIYFNYLHHFEPLKYQWGHTMADTNLGHFWSFIGSQCLLLGMLPFLLLPWILIQSKELNSDFRFHVLFVFFAAPFAFVLFQAMRSYLEANWILMSYITFWPIAQRLYDVSSFKLQARLFYLFCFLPGFIVAGAILIHLVRPLAVIPPQKDRVYRMKEQTKLMEQVAIDLQDNQRGEVLLTPLYQLTSYFKFFGLHSEQLTPGTRKSTFTLDPFDACSQETILYFSEDTESPNALACFANRTLLREYPLVVRGKQMAHYKLFEYSKN